MISYFLEFIIFIILILLIFQIIKFAFYLFYVWQIVEYRLDRISSRLQNRGDLKELLGYLNVFNINNFSKYPKITLRIFLSLLFLFFLYYQLIFVFYRFLYNLNLFGNEFIFNLLAVFFLIYFLTPILISLIIIFIGFLLIPFKILFVYLAKKKIEKYKKLIVIGITGSYGKSSTKEIVYQTLSLKYKVLKTPANQNTLLGVAKTVLFSLNKNHQLFVVEMGAYKPGEIKAICDLVSPDIGILTGINEQHLSLYKNLKNTIKTKSELINSLPKGNLAFFNAQDKRCLNLSKKYKNLKVVLYGKKTKLYEEAFDLSLILSKIYKIPYSKFLKIKSKIKKICSLKKIRGINQVLIFDDSYSSNPAGFEKAIKIISVYPQKKLVVTPGIIELGKESEKIHKKIGKILAKKIDKIIITSENFSNFIKSGAGKQNLEKFLVSNNENEINEWLGGSLNRNWLILLEGRVPLNIKKIFFK